TAGASSLTRTSSSGPFLSLGIGLIHTPSRAGCNLICASLGFLSQKKFVQRSPICARELRMRRTSLFFRRSPPRCGPCTSLCPPGKFWIRLEPSQRYRGFGHTSRDPRPEVSRGRGMLHCTRSDDIFFSGKWFDGRSHPPLHLIRRGYRSRWAYSGGLRRFHDANGRIGEASFCAFTVPVGADL